MGEEPEESLASHHFVVEPLDEENTPEDESLDGAGRAGVWGARADEKQVKRGHRTDQASAPPERREKRGKPERQRDGHEAPLSGSRFQTTATATEPMSADPPPSSATEAV